MGRFKDDICLVTGGARGIPRAIADALLAEGGRVVIVDRDIKALIDHGYGSDLAVIQADIGEADLASLQSEISAKFGTPNRLILGSAFSAGNSIGEVEEEDLELAWRSNISHPLLITRDIFKALESQGRPGSAVFISSLHDRFVRGLVEYSATKAALRMVIKELADFYAPSSIRVNGIAPGAVMEDHSNLAQQDIDLFPLGRPGSPADLTEAGLFLLDDAASGYVTGTVIDVDGGLALRSWWDKQSRQDRPLS